MNIKTERLDIVDIIEGNSIQDPYRWLEDYSNPKVKEWTENQNKYLDENLRNKNFDKFSEELILNYKSIDFSNPILFGGKYFYGERKPEEDQPSIYYKEGINGDPIKLVDPNIKKNSKTESIDFWQPSFSGKYLAYGTSQNGDEMATLYIKDVEKNINLSEEIPRCRYARVRWLSDDSGFFYTRNPKEGEVPQNEYHMHTKVYFHKLGDNTSMDKLIFGEGRPKEDMISLSNIPPSVKYLGISVSSNWSENDIFIYNLASGEITPLIKDLSAKFTLIFVKDKALLYTNYKANNFRVLSNSVDNLFLPIDEWAELIPEKDFLLEDINITKSKIIACYLENVCSRLRIFDFDGIELGEVPLPPYSIVSNVSTNRNEEEFFYSVVSFIFPKIVYRFNTELGNFEIYRKAENPIDENDYVVKQEWFDSKDKTRVPVFIFHKKNVLLGEPRPTILYGYGGFGNMNTPGFLKSYIPWVERGGIFAIANIRGGGEFGKKWHEAGIKENKQNSFDDFISAGEYLIEKGYTNKEHLGILGASNGGLLVSAVSVQRPDLFKAVCSRVPLTDMVRFPLFGIASRWVNEYGDPSKKGDLENILKWSPYHNVKEGSEYPATLFLTATNDTRVDPLHSRKMAAMLQYANKTNPVFIFTESDAGHGAGKPISKVVESSAITLNFFAEKLGLDI